MFAQSRLARPWRQTESGQQFLWLGWVLGVWRQGAGKTCPSRACTLVYVFQILNWIFFNEKGIFYVASVVSPLPWCVVCFRTVPVHPWPGHSPSSLQFCGCPGVCALWLFLQSSWWSGPLYFCMESRISLLVQQKGWLQR